MDGKLLYWTGAFINFAAVCALALVGVKRIRARDVRGHRRMMLASSALVLGFLVSYVLKLMVLGPENLLVWDSLSRWSLRIHESWIAIMILCGAYAGYRAFGFRRSLPTTGLLNRLSRTSLRKSWTCSRIEPTSRPARYRLLRRRAAVLPTTGSMAAVAIVEPGRKRL